MAQPTPYTPVTNFAADEAASLSGRSNVRTANLDAEFSALNTTVDHILTNLSIIQRDDTQLRDRVVGATALSAEVTALFALSGATIRGAWLTATAYAVKDVVTQGGITYICAVAHTSGTFATDLAAVKWVPIFDAAAGIFTPTATIASTTIQTAIVEVEQDGIASLATTVAAYAATAGSTLLGWIRAAAGAAARTLSAKVGDIVSVKDFGALGDGSTDDTVAIQAAITHAQTFSSTTGLCIYFPRGSYCYSTLLVSTGGVHLMGDQDVRLLKTTTTGNGLVIKSTGARIYVIKLTGLSFAQATAVATTGAQIYMENVGQCNLTNVYISQYPFAPWKGLEMLNVAQQEIHNLEIQNCLSDGWVMTDCIDFYVTPSRVDSNGGRGIYMDTCAGLYFHSVNTYGNALEGYKGVQLVGAPVLATAGFAYNFFIACISDTSGSHNWHISKMTHSTLTACWGSSQSGTTVNKHGLFMSECQSVNVTDFLSLANNACGMFIETSSIITVSGGRFNGNGKQAGSAQRAGIYVGTGCQAIIDGTNCQDTLGFATQQYGLRVQVTVSKLSINNSDFSSNAAAPYLFDGVPSTYYESGNYTGESIVVASASVVTLPMFGSVFEISGTTNIDAFNYLWPKREVRLIFQGVLTVNDAGSVKIAGNFTTSADDTLSLISNGTNWYETSRSVN